MAMLEYRVSFDTDNSDHMRVHALMEEYSMIRRLDDVVGQMPAPPPAADNLPPKHPQLQPKRRIGAAQRVIVSMCSKTYGATAKELSEKLGRASDVSVTEIQKLADSHGYELTKRARIKGSTKGRRIAFCLVKRS
jgi:hypothetical protein